MDIDSGHGNASATVANSISQQPAQFAQSVIDTQTMMNGGTTTTANGGDAMDMDMDLDIDIDAGPETAPIFLETEPVLRTIYPAEAQQAAAIATPSSEDAAPEKVHIRGVDELTTDDIKAFANEQFADEAPTKIEWIDDTSANIVYSSPEVGLRALAALSQEQPEKTGPTDDTLRLRLARTSSKHPESVLQVRTAVITDKKKARAHEASRFYLLHPEYDPRERPRNKSRRKDGGDGNYTRRRFDDREHRRRLDLVNDQNLTESMYDDDVDMDAGTTVKARGRGRSRGGKDLFPDESKDSGRLRGRSTSPVSSRNYQSRSDGYRDRSPRPRKSRGRESGASGNRGKELFSTSKELFSAGSPTASSHDSSTSFLKGHKSAVSRHRRSGAFDAADVTANLSQRVSTPDSGTATPAGRMNSAVELFPQYTAAEKEKLRIRGAVHEEDHDRGISIKGAASARVRELFPNKFNANQGKELFTDKIQGRGGRRRLAEDMFG